MKEHVEKGKVLPMLRDDCDAAYITKLAMLAQDVNAGRRLNHWSGYCMLSWPDHTLRFMDGSQVWRVATMFGRLHRTDLESPFFAVRHNREFFPVPSEEKRRLYVATPALWKVFESGHTLRVWTCSVFAYKANDIFNVD